MTIEAIQAEIDALKGKPGRKSKEVTARIAELEAAIAAAGPNPEALVPYAKPIPAARIRVKKVLHPSARAGIVCPHDEETPEGLAWWQANYPKYVGEIYE